MVENRVYKYRINRVTTCGHLNELYLYH